jgi:restriction system protein
VAKNQSLWAEIQRERARRQRIEQQSFRAAVRAAEKAEREGIKAERDAAREAVVNEKERRRLYVEERKGEAARMGAAVRARAAELETILPAGIRSKPFLTFSSLKRSLRYPAFDAGGLERQLPRPLWEQFAPTPPSGLGKLLGGTARFEQQEARAREAYAEAGRQHAAAESDRRARLEERRSAYSQAAAVRAAEVATHNAEVDQYQADYLAGDPGTVAEFCMLALGSSVYPPGFPHRTRVLYRPEPRELVVEVELPPESLIPVDRDYKYVATRDAIDSLPRAEKEIKERYRVLIAQVALRTIHESFMSDPHGMIDLVTFYGHVSTTDPATGQPARPLLLQASAQRELFGTFVLASLDPVQCLYRLNALVSPHPYDLEPVRPTVSFETLLAQFKFFEGIDVIAGLDSRPDLLAMTPYEFEHLVRQIYEAMGLEAWTTEAIKDDGVDAVAVSKAPVFGGLHHPGQALQGRGRDRGGARTSRNYGRQARRHQGNHGHHVLGHQVRARVRRPSWPYRDRGVRAPQISLQGVSRPRRADQPAKTAASVG